MLDQLRAAPPSGLYPSAVASVCTHVLDVDVHQRFEASPHNHELPHPEADLDLLLVEDGAAHKDVPAVRGCHHVPDFKRLSGRYFWLWHAPATTGHQDARTPHSSRSE